MTRSNAMSERAQSALAGASPFPEALLSQEVPTPALVVERSVVRANIAAMAGRAALAGVELWPHVKTHKTREVAALQLAAGAAGLTAATIAEAEMMADAGARRLLVAYPPVDRWRVERLLALSRRVEVTTVLDDAATALRLEEACERAEARLSFLWEVDCGTHRCGTAPGGATVSAVTALVGRLEQLRFAGLMTFSGHSYAARSADEIRDIAREEIAAVRDTATDLGRAGVRSPVLSIGSSPTAHFLDEQARGVQCRAGVYVFNDRTQVALGVAPEAACALTVLSTVVSRPAPGRVILDAGSKALSSDRQSALTPGFGACTGLPGLSLDRLYEEHAICSLGEGADLPIGSRVRIVPNHACSTVNLHRSMLVVEDGAVVAEWETTSGWS